MSRQPEHTQMRHTPGPWERGQGRMIVGKSAAYCPGNREIDHDLSTISAKNAKILTGVTPHRPDRSSVLMFFGDST